jgi:hypothetical protein
MVSAMALSDTLNDTPMMFHSSGSPENSRRNARALACAMLSMA